MRPRAWKSAPHALPHAGAGPEALPGEGFRMLSDGVIEPLELRPEIFRDAVDVLPGSADLGGGQRLTGRYLSVDRLREQVVNPQHIVAEAPEILSRIVPEGLGRLLEGQPTSQRRLR